METLWNELSNIGKVYAVIAFVFSLLFVFQIILSFFGGDHDHDVSGDADADVDSDSGIPFQFITLKNLTAFFTIAGWAGLLCVQSNLNPVLTVIISFFAGLLMMLIMATIFYFMSKLTDSGNVNEDNAIGSNAEVYLIIPAQRKGSGKISVVVQGRLNEYSAVSDDVEDIPTGSRVKILEKISAQTFLVTKI